MIQLSVVIITLNEEANIERCLLSVTNIADEVVVVDSFSTDKTEEICLRHNTKFVKQKFLGHIEQKNFALQQAKYDYCLSLDADEVLTPELEKSILAVKSNFNLDGYYINRLTSYCGQWIKHCGWYPDWNLRLINKTKGKWTGTNPHDRYELFEKSKTKKLNGNLLHYTFHTIEQHTKQIQLFTDISSKAAFDKGKKSNWLKIYFKAGFKFFRDYILKLGFLDGYYGFIICKKSSHAKYLKYLKLLKLQQANDSTSS